MSDEARNRIVSALVQFVATGAIGLALWYAAFEVKFARAEERIEMNTRAIGSAKLDIVRRLERIEDKLDRYRGGVSR